MIGKFGQIWEEFRQNLGKVWTNLGEI